MKAIKNKALLVFEGPRYLRILLEILDILYKHTRGDEYLPHSSVLLAFLSSSDLSAMTRGSCQRERRSSETQQSLSSRYRDALQQQRLPSAAKCKGSRESLGESRVLRRFAPTCMHEFNFNSHPRFQFKDFGPICTCMPANQGLSTGRKRGVRQGEIFVMEIWTAGVAKQKLWDRTPQRRHTLHMR